MKQLVKLIKKYRLVLLALLLFAVLVVVLLLFRSKIPTKPQEISSATVAKKEFVLNYTVPAEGPRSSVDTTEYIQLSFSDAVDLSTAKVTSLPNIKLDIKVFSRDPNTLWLIPKQDRWQPNTSYTITIDKSLKSVSGAPLKEDIVYRYYNTPPESVMSGENN